MPGRRRKRGFVSNVLLPLGGGLAITAAMLGGFALWADVPLVAPGPPADDAGAEAAAAAEVMTVGPPDRNVTPEGVTPGPRADGVLVRVPPDAAQAAAPREPETLFRRVVVLDAGRFRTVRDRQPILVHLAGVKAPGFRDTCRDPEGKTWKCGARARAELARLIVNRAVACVIVDDSEPTEPIGRCRVGVYDLSEWMVEGGWADPGEDAGPALRQAAEEAQRKARGRFGPAPQGIIAG